MDVFDPKQFRTRGREAGFTLAEMLIAMAIFIIAATVAFLLYDNAQRSFKQGEEITEQQQVTRVAFDKMIAELRMAGFNYNPTGNPAVTDEQIEGAWSTAVTLRGDFDAEDPTASASPEAALAAGSPFSVVSTGNDEIVTYALAKDAGNLGGDTLTFFADKNSPRDLTADQIDVNNIALASQSDPPYTLYRITLSTAGAAVKEPLADNLRSLTFTYYDASGTALDPAVMTGTETTAARAERAKVRRITIDVEGLTPNNDVRYTDAADTDPDTQHRRKFHLVSDVQARNLGMVGAPDPDNTPPTTPTGLAACEGHCGGLVLTWNPNPADQSVIVYNIKFGTSPAALNSVVSYAASPAYLSGLIDTNNYYFAIQAQDSSGNKSAFSSNVGPIALSSDTVPLQVQNLSAAGSGTNIDLAWDAVSENTDAGASAAAGGCDPNRPARRDGGGYKVYRLKSPGGTFNLTDAGVTSAAASGTTYTDTGVVLCATYGYRVTAIDTGCSAPLEGSPSAMATASTSAVAQPEKPTGGSARIISGGHAQVDWNPVTLDTASPPNTIAVERYNLYHALVDTGASPVQTPANVTYTLVDSNQLTCSIPTSCVHNNGGAGTTATVIRYYKVAAATDCSGAFAEGLLGDPFPLACSFDGTPTFTNLSNGDDVTAGTVAVNLDVSGGTSTYTQAVFTFTRVSDGAVAATITDNTWSGTSPNFSVTWNASGLSGEYRIDAVVTQADGCPRMASVTVDVVTPVTCCLTVTSATVITQGALKKELRITFSNFCGVTLSVDQFSIAMTDSVNRDAKLSSAEFDSVGEFFTDAGGQVVEGAPFVLTLSPVQTLTDGTHTLTLNFKNDISNCAGTNNAFTVTLRYTRPETGATTYTCTFDITSAVVTCI